MGFLQVREDLQSALIEARGCLAGLGDTASVDGHGSRPKDEQLQGSSFGAAAPSLGPPQVGHACVGLAQPPRVFTTGHERDSLFAFRLSVCIRGVARGTGEFPLPRRIRIIAAARADQESAGNGKNRANRLELMPGFEPGHG